MVVGVNFTHHAAQCVSVDAQSPRSLRLITIIPGQYFLDKPPLEFGDCIFEVDPVLNHLVNQ